MQVTESPGASRRSGQLADGATPVPEKAVDRTAEELTVTLPVLVTTQP